MQPKILSRPEQRAKAEHNAMVAMGLEAHLINLTRQILSGELSQLGEFQQMIQYASPEMRARIDSRIANDNPAPTFRDDDK